MAAIPLASSELIVVSESTPLVEEKGKVKNKEEVIFQLCSKEVIAKGSNKQLDITPSCTSPGFELY